MLAELYQLARNVEAQGITLDPVHNNFGTPGLTSHTNLLARIYATGNKISLKFSLLPKEHGFALWTLKNNNFKYFPAVRPKSPLFHVNPDSELWESLKKPGRNTDLTNWKSKIQSEMKLLREADGDGNLDIDLSDGIENADRVSKWSSSEKSGITPILEIAYHYRLLSRDSARAGNIIYKACLDMLVTATNQDECKAALALLVGNLKESKNKPPTVEFKVQLLLDLSLPGDPAFTIYTRRMQHKILDQLLSESAASTEKQPCLFSPSGGTRLKSPMSGWSAPPVVSKSTAPYSKFGDALCNARYHLSDSASLPISTESAQRIVASLNAATDPSRKGINWRFVKNGKFERKRKQTNECSDVLIVYPSFDDHTLRGIDVLAKPETTSETESSSKIQARVRQFETLGKDAIERLEKVSSSEAVRDYIRILCIRKVDDMGKIQLAYHATPSTQQFKEAIKRWEASGDFLPEQFRVPFPSSKSPTGLTRPLRPNLLFPEEIPRLLARKWIRDGTDSRPLESPSVGDIFDLFLMQNPDEHSLATQLLDITLERCGVLLSNAGQALRKGRDIWKNHCPKTKANTLDTRKTDPRYEYPKALSLTGTLLHIMNSNPDDPKNAAAFKVGRLLAMADELHKQYSIAVRSKSKNENGKTKIDMPTTLIGNGLLSRAGDDPASAIADLLDRGRIYIGWAKTQTGRSKSNNPLDIAINSARKVARLYQPLADELNTLGIPRELDTESRAHLFLGYLAPVLGQNGAKSDGEDQSNENQSDQDYE